MQSLRAAQPHLNREDSGETLILIPPTPEEQKSIVHYIETECALIDIKEENAGGGMPGGMGGGMPGMM